MKQKLLPKFGCFTENPYICSQKRRYNYGYSYIYIRCPYNRYFSFQIID